jgi:hypothetical protein
LDFLLIVEEEYNWEVIFQEILHSVHKLHEEIGAILYDDDICIRIEDFLTVRDMHGGRERLIVNVVDILYDLLLRFAESLESAGDSQDDVKFEGNFGVRKLGTIDTNCFL